MMQCKVPQDVLRPDKIVGFLTLRQLIICMIGGGICYSLYTILSKQYFIEIWLGPVVFVTAVTVAFAFIRYHDIPFEKLVLLFIEYKFLPRRRAWQKMAGDPLISVFSTPRAMAAKTLHAEESASVRHKKLQEVSRLVDTQGKNLTSTKHSN